MASNLITPPDHIVSGHSMMIINAKTTALDTVVLWLRTVTDEYDLHLYHSQMTQQDAWAVTVAMSVTKILVCRSLAKYHCVKLQQALDNRTQSIVDYGPDTVYPELIHYFLKNRQIH